MSKHNLTVAGRRLLTAYVELESKKLLVAVILKDGTLAQAMTLRPGDGGEKAAALKLQRDGFAHVSWRLSWGGRNERYFVITEDGRSALSPSTANIW